MQPLEDYLEQQRQRVEVSLDECLPTSRQLSVPPHGGDALQRVCRGKRLRPILTLAAAEAVAVAMLSGFCQQRVPWNTFIPTR